MNDHDPVDGVVEPTGANAETQALPGEESSVASARVARVRKNDVAVIVDVDEVASELLGWSAEDMVGRSSIEFIHPDDHQVAVESWMQLLGAPGRGHPVTLRHRHRDGSWIWVEMTNHNLLDDPAHNCVVAEMVVISGDMAAEESLPARHTEAESQPRRLHEALRDREQVLRRLSEALPLGVLQVDAGGRVVYTNHKLHTILGVPRAATVEEQLCVVLPEDKGTVDEAFEAVLGGGLDSDIEVRLRISDEHGTKDERQCTMSLRTLTAEIGAVTGAIACLADVTDNVRIREELRRRATFDEVTRCHNRTSTMEHLETALAASDEQSQPAVIFLDLNRFKEINDRLGHAAGDELLAIVAKRLLGAVRREDLVGRIGGDEFLVVCPGVTSEGQALRAATRLADAFRHPIRLKTAHVSCHASIGVAWAAGSPRDADVLVSQADTAMYEAKRRRSGLPVLFTPSTNRF